MHSAAGLVATEVGLLTNHVKSKDGVDLVTERLSGPSMLVTVIVFLEQFEGVFGGSIEGAGSGDGITELLD